MALSVNAELSALLAAATSQAEWFSVFETAFATRRVVCKRNGTTFRDCALTGAMTFSNGVITHLGYTSDTTVYLAADLSTGTSVLRLESASHWMEGTLGLSGSGCDFIMDENPTTANGLAFGTVAINAPSGLAGSVVATFTLENWDATTTRTLFRGGMPFAQGDVPAGSALIVKRSGTDIASQFDERSYWPDGSLRFAVCHLRDSDSAGSATASYEVWATTGSFDNTGTKVLADVATAAALTVEVSSLNQWDGTSSTQRGSGAALATFATHAAVASRATKIHSGPVCEGWQVWGMFKDGADGSGSEDAHLKAVWYVDVWKDENGDVLDTEYGVVLAQNWWGVADKYRLDYTATLKRSGSTVQAYASVQHPYHAEWMTARMTDDHNHGRRHWVSAVPTLLYKFSKTYWVASKMVAPFATDFTPDANTTVTYVPGSSQQHRASLDDTGAYMGRGMLPNNDVKAFMRQTALDNRAARVNAFAGLHLPDHYRDERTRTLDSVTDVANTLIPLLWTPKADADSTFEGLPTPKHAYRGPSAPENRKGGWIAPLGGTGVWNRSQDSSHAVAYSTFAYMLEGERYMLESVIDIATKASHILNGNAFGGTPYLHWYENTAARTEMSIPSTQWHGATDLRGQERAAGWSMMVAGHAAALVPDSDPSSGYLRAWNSHQNDYLQLCYDYTPPSLKSVGLTYQSTGGQPIERSQWMSAFVVQGCLQNYRMNGGSGTKTYADMVTKMLAAYPSRQLYDSGNVYHALFGPKNQTYDLATNPYFATGDYLVSVEGATASSNVLDVSSVLLWDVLEDEVVYFYAMDSRTVPSGFVEGTPYYAVNASGKTCQLAETVGGSPMTIANGTYSVGIRSYGGQALTAAAFPPYMPNADSYYAIMDCTLTMALLEGCEHVNAGLVASMKTFMAPVSRAAWPAWHMEVPV